MTAGSDPAPAAGPAGCGFDEPHAARAATTAALIRWMRMARILRRLSAELDAEHRDRAAVEAVGEEPDRIAVARRAEHVEQRQVVIRRRDGERGVGQLGVRR